MEAASVAVWKENKTVLMFAAGVWGINGTILIYGKSISFPFFTRSCIPF